MTVIACRDGVLVVDSLVTGGTVRYGTARKWAEVHPHRGGGFVAGTGSLGPVARFLAAMAEPVAALDDMGDDDAALWLLPSGDVREWTVGGWVSIDAPFHAIGDGNRFALGAMAHGASAEEAARIACEFCTTCGGPLVVLTASAE